MFFSVFDLNQLGIAINYSCPLLTLFKRRTIQFENNESEEDSLVRQATLRTIRCTTNPMDLVCVELAGGRFATNSFLFFCIAYKEGFLFQHLLLFVGWLGFHI